MTFKSLILIKLSFNQNIETFIISAKLLQKVITYYIQPNILLYGQNNTSYRLNISTLRYSLGEPEKIFAAIRILWLIF